MGWFQIFQGPYINHHPNRFMNPWFISLIYGFRWVLWISLDHKVDVYHFYMNVSSLDHKSPCLHVNLKSLHPQITSPGRLFLCQEVVRQMSADFFGLPDGNEEGEAYCCFLDLNTENWLVVFNINFMTFHILGIIIPTDELIFFRGVGIPPTSFTLLQVYVD